MSRHTDERWKAEVPERIGKALAHLGLEGISYEAPRTLKASMIGLLNLSERGTLFRCSKGAVVCRADQTMIVFNKIGL